MNTKRSILSAALVAALSLSAAGLQAQERPLGQDRQGDYRQGKDRNEFRTKAEVQPEKIGKIGKFHKASKLVGMNVKNQADEGLGEIKELVVDLESGRISYVVLGVGGVLGIGEKYIAIPPSAFNYSADGDYLVLNADKSKVEQAPGFTRDNWPDVENPAWGAYWGIKGTGTSGHLGQQGRLGGLGDMFSGEIVSINHEARTMTVKGDSVTQVFIIDQGANLKLKGSATAQLSDLKVGDRVNVKFHKQGDGAGTVHSIESADAK